MFFVYLALALLLAIALLGLLAKQAELARSASFWLGTLGFVCLVVLGYQLLGAPGLVLNQQAKQQFEASTQTLIDQLEQKLQAQPKDVEGWRMLGRSYQSLQQSRKAANAFEQAYQLDQNHAPTLLALAENLAANEQGHFNLRAQALVVTAYKLAPENPDALWLYGLVSQQQGDFIASYQAWSELLAQLDPQSQEAQELAKMLKEYEKNLNKLTTPEN